MPQNEHIPLTAAKRGSLVRVVGIPEGKSKAQLLRLGILQGEIVRCLERLPGGTVVIEKNRQEIAIGDSLARAIFVVIAIVE